MPVPFYMDVHLPEAVTSALRRRDVEILTSQADNTRTWDDEALLSWATELKRILVTQDSDLLRIAQDRQKKRPPPFSGVIYSHQQTITIGQLVEDLYLVSTCCEIEEFFDLVVYLPMK